MALNPPSSYGRSGRTTPASSPGGLSRGSGRGMANASHMPTRPLERGLARHKPACSLCLYLPQLRCPARCRYRMTNSYTSEEVASGFITADVSASRQRWFRIKTNDYSRVSAASFRRQARVCSVLSHTLPRICSVDAPGISNLPSESRVAPLQPHKLMS
jgi:hypothetical protein